MVKRSQNQMIVSFKIYTIYQYPMVITSICKLPSLKRKKKAYLKNNVIELILAISLT